jgi:hypothetical protein
LLENPAVFKEIEDQIRDQLLVQPVKDAAAKAALKAQARNGVAAEAEDVKAEPKSKGKVKEPSIEAPEA